MGSNDNQKAHFGSCVELSVQFLNVVEGKELEKRSRKEAVLQVLKAARKFPRFTKTLKGVSKLEYSTQKQKHGGKKVQKRALKETKEKDDHAIHH